MKRNLSIVLLLVMMLSGLYGCKMNEKEEFKVININIYKDTIAWDLAKAVNSQNIAKIKKIATESPNLLNFQDPKYQTTLLVWAVGTEKYKSAEALLKFGSDPNIISGYVGGTALYLASGFSWIDNQAKKDPKYVKLLLEYVLSCRFA